MSAAMLSFSSPGSPKISTGFLQGAGGWVGEVCVCMVVLVVELEGLGGWGWGWGETAGKLEQTRCCPSRAPAMQKSAPMSCTAAARATTTTVWTPNQPKYRTKGPPGPHNSPLTWQQPPKAKTGACELATHLPLSREASTIWRRRRWA